MLFRVTRCRREGVVVPRHFLWSGAQVGHLWIDEALDPALHRRVRAANLKAEKVPNQALLPPLHDVVLLSAKPDWWTMTGWEFVTGEKDLEPRAFQQSWILIPYDMELAEQEMSRRRVPDPPISR